MPIVDLDPPYPGVFPVDAIMLVIDRLRGQQVDAHCLVHAGWVVLGFALLQAGPVHPPVMQQVKSLTDAELADALQGAVNASETKSVEAFDWKAILKTLGPIFLAWLNSL